MLVKVITDEIDVHSRLAQLGLTLAPLHEAVMQGYLVRANYTANYPRAYIGYSTWAETVAGLRDGLRVSGWKKLDEGNYELTVNSERDMAISVITGDEATGIVHRTPSNRCPKGASTMEAIAANNQLQLFAEFVPPTEEKTGFTTWALLFHISENEIRSELSLPSDISTDGRIRAWVERIILPAIPRGELAFEISPPDVPDIDIPIQRKA